jgi:hypothetical protein
MAEGWPTTFWERTRTRSSGRRGALLDGGAAGEASGVGLSFTANPPGAGNLEVNSLVLPRYTGVNQEERDRLAENRLHWRTAL